MKIAINILQALLLILGAPLVRGIIARCKALLQRRQGASIWRPYSDLAKLFRKEDLVPPTASGVFRLVPFRAVWVHDLCGGLRPVSAAFSAARFPRRLLLLGLSACHGAVLSFAWRL